MKRFILLFSLAIALVVSSTAFAKDDGKGATDEILRRSVLFEPDPKFGPDGSSYPQPFDEQGSGGPINNSRYSTAVSTGYYFVDSGSDEITEPWHPTPTFLDINTEPANWRRVISGPAQWDISEAKNNLGQDGRPVDGYRFFHNPNQSLDPLDPNYDNGNYDSTDNAIAGPIPIGFDFYFNGLRYDSFYVSTNGIISLSNRRYLYNLSGQRKVPDGATNCYDPMSSGWFTVGNRIGDGTTDPIIDNNGFLTTWNTMQQYPSGTSFNNLYATGNTGAYIAPFWGDGHLSQYSIVSEGPEDYGKVYYYRNSAGNKLVIYYKNFALKGTLTYLKSNKSTYNQPSDRRHTDATYCGVDCQVTLDRTDSSVTIDYLTFEGKYSTGLYINWARELFLWNTYSGVYGIVYDQDYNSKTGLGVSAASGTYPWGNINAQYTTYWSKFESTEETYPTSNMAVKYKQWKNTVRYVDIQYRVRPRVKVNGAYSDEYTEEVKTTEANDYELLAGHDIIGQIQPVVLVQNLTNDIQGKTGVNFTPQDLEFKVRMTIKNLALEKSIYNKAVKVDSLNLATRYGQSPFTKVILSEVTYSGGNYEADNEALYTNINNDDNPVWVINDDSRGNAVNGVPPYGFAQVFFPPFEPNEFYPNQIGRMRAYLMCEPRNPYTGGTLKDMWPFDDTTSVRFFVMQRIKATETFTDDVTEWHQVPEEGSMPSILKWVNIGCSVVSGEEVSRHPLPPRGSFQCANEDVFPNTKISSPTIRLYRPASVQMGQVGGTEIRSYPIDLRGKNGARLSFSVQRNLNPEGRDWTRDWTDQNWIGVEHRVCKDNWYTQDQAPDELRIEFALPSPDGVQGIANIGLYDVDETPGIQPGVNKDKRWRYHQRRGGAKEETNMSAFSVFGGGGYMVGFIRTDDPAAPDSAMLPPNYAGRVPNGLHYDFFDDGIDYKFTRFNVPIPDTIINAPNDGAFNFRFRIKAHCTNNQQPQKMADDEDNIYVDNIRIVHSGNEDVDLEMTSVNIRWPYTQMPASQAIRMPIEVELTNNTSFHAPSFFVKVRICDLTKFMQGDTSGSTIYCRTKSFPTLRAGETKILDMPTWDAAHNKPGKYRIISSVYVPNNADIESSNDTTYYDYEVRFSDVLAYDEPNTSTNSVPGYPGAKAGRGLTTYGHSKGGTDGGYQAYYGYGAESGDGSGQIAMKFTLDQADTIKGFQAYFCPLSKAQDDIAFCLYEGLKEKDTPGARIDSTEIYTIRGWDDIDMEFKWDEYVNVLMPKPIILPAGTYWVAISQLGETGLELGATESRSGMRTTRYYRHDLNPADEEMNGSSSMHLMIDKSFRLRNSDGNLVNYCVFAFENTHESGQWEPFMPTSDNPGYAHLNYRGVVTDGTITNSRGTWIPFVRPYLGERVHGTVLDTVPCEEVPVELAEFNGFTINNHVELEWQTASEENNYGFYIERKLNTDEENAWTSIGFVKGVGTSKESNYYSFKDTKVEPNMVYNYRLHQVDAQGHTSCESYSNVVVLTIGDMLFNISQNEPNPAAFSTEFAYTLPEAGNARVDVIDIFGNVVKVINDGPVSGGSHSVKWDVRSDNGARLVPGTYTIRLSFEGKITTRQIQVVR